MLYCILHWNTKGVMIPLHCSRNPCDCLDYFRFFRSQEAGYEDRLERLADQFQEYKFAAHRDKLQLQETLRLREEAMEAESAMKEQALRMEITKLEQELQKAKEEVNMANEWKVQFTEQFQALQTNFTELRQIYMEDQMEWEDRLEMEQNARQKDRTLAESVLRQAQEEAEAKARRARMEASLALESVKSDFNNKLWQKESALQTTARELVKTARDKEELEGKVEIFESEREDLSALTKQTAKVAKDVAKSKATNTIEKAKNLLFRRKKME
jgi:hypothetical protein